ERGIGVAGSAEFTRSFAAALLVDACTRLGPADLDVVVLTDPGRAPAWEWVKWLPHTRVDDLPGPYSSQTDVAAWLARSASGERRWSANRYHVTLVIVDEHAWWHGRSAPLHAMLDDHALPLRFVVLGPTPDALPVACGTVVRERTHDGATLDAAEGHEHIERFVPFLAAPVWARRAALALAPLDDQALVASEHASSWPSSSFAEAVDLDATDEVAIVARWRAGDGLRIMIGDAGEGPVRLDLDTNGPHAVVAGVDAAGMRELLRTIVAGIAATNSPDDMVIVLVDQSDGEVFGPCVDLPHVTRCIFGIDERGVAELVARLRAEVESRGDATGVAPNVVVVVHSGGAGAGTPGAVLSAALAEFAAWAGQTSVHLVAAVTAEEGDMPPIVDPRLAALAGTRVALRVRHDADSLALLGDVAAARIPHHDPGRGVLATARGRVVPFRTITTSGPARSMQAWPDVRPFVVARDPTPMERRLVAAARTESRTPGDGGATVIDRVVEAIGAAAAMPSEHPAGPRRNPTLALPTAVDVEQLLAWFPGDSVPYALVDDPAAGFTDARGAGRRARWWQPGAATITMRAADRASRDIVTDWICALALGVAARAGDDDVALHIVTAQPGRLAALSTLPHVVDVSGPSDPHAVLATARVLNEVIARRRDGGT
ncbi:MAG TPA: FtsK/SpoIIIE domain-containing protein, partial [Ilumatobacteraceae bacterium]